MRNYINCSSANFGKVGYYQIYWENHKNNKARYYKILERAKRVKGVDKISLVLFNKYLSLSNI